MGLWVAEADGSFPAILPPKSACWTLSAVPHVHHGSVFRVSVLFLAGSFNISSSSRRTAGLKTIGCDNGARAIALCRKAFAWGAVGTIVLIVPQNVLEVGFVRARSFVSLQPVICTPFF